MPSLDADIQEYYERGEEQDRLTGVDFPSGRLEFARTQELVARHLGEPPLEIVDVGGGPGLYAAWLAELGHHVQLVDPIALHVEQAIARDSRIDASVGDARDLPQADASADVVLLMGPLYHLVDPDDRLRALAEARRVLRPDGILVVAVISRFAALHDLLSRTDRLFERHVRDAVARAVQTGVFRVIPESPFTTAYFHTADELRTELEDAGLPVDGLFNVEGPAGFLPDLDERWADDGRRALMLWAARLVESEPSLFGAASHLLAVSRRPRG
jgi:ubiquinone/menaquinone biosynthesis C-methylase UbiE